MNDKTRKKRARQRRAALARPGPATARTDGARTALGDRDRPAAAAVAPAPRADGPVAGSAVVAPPADAAGPPAAPAESAAAVSTPSRPLGRWLARLPRPPHAVPARVADAIALGVIALAAAALFVDSLLFGRVDVERDTYLFYYPVYQWFAEQLKAGHLPLWMPQLFSGYPLYADGETGMLYPLHWLFFGLLPTPSAFIALRVLHFVMAGAFMYAWMRALALRRLGALLAGLTFAYGSFLVGQMHHENLIRTAVWLPLVLCWTELAYRRAGRARALCLLAGGATLGVQLTALHVQPALMTLMALALYVAFRTLCPPVDLSPGPSPARGGAHTEEAQRAAPPSRAGKGVGGLGGLAWLARRVALGALALGTIIGLGIGLAAAQLLPLYELGIQTFRGERVPFAFATSYSLHPTQLATLLFPYFFRNDYPGSWSLWVGWETLIYVGVAPLVLALVALAAVRRREVAFFGGLALFGALLAFGDYSPLPLLELLWPLPGFSALRVPGRYSLLLVVALAALAGFGLDWLERTAHRDASEPGRRGALLAVALGVSGGVAALMLLFVLGRQRLLEAPQEAKAVIASTYLAVRRMFADLNSEWVYVGLLNSLDLGNRRTELGFALLLAVAALLTLCYLAGRRAALWRAGLVLLTAADLVLWGRSFHPHQSLAELLSPPPSVQYLQAQGDPLGRLWVSSDKLLELEYNRPATWGIAQAGGYSSLEPQRQAEYAAVVANTPGTLVDLWGVRWVAVPTRVPWMPAYKSTSFYPGRALFDAGAGNPAAEERFNVPDRPATEVRLIAALAYAEELPDGATVGEVVVTAVDGRRQTLPLRVGQHVSEWTHARGDIRPRVKHRLAEVAHTDTDRDMVGAAYPVYYFYSEHPLPERWAVRSVELRYRHGIGALRVFGMAVYDDATGQAHQVVALDRAKYRLVYADGDVRLYENTAAFPRAFVAGAGVLPRPELGGLYSMYLDPFDPRSEVLLDRPPTSPAAGATPADGAGGGMAPLRRMGQGVPTPPAGVRAATIEAYAPERVVVRATAERPGFLVLTDLYHPGWRARVDGAEAELLRGDYLFRAVPIGPGSHEVEFVFDPPTVHLGRLLSLLTLAALASAAVALWRWPRRRPDTP